MTNYPPLHELREAIKANGYRFDWFAAQVGLSPDYFNHQLAGRKRPDPGLFLRASVILGCEPDALKPAAPAEAELVA